MTDAGTPDSHEGAGQPASPDGDVAHADPQPAPPAFDPAPGHTRDPRYETRRQNERRRRARLEAEKVERENKEDLCLAFVTSGMSYRQVAQRVGLSKSQVERLYKAGLDRASNDTPDQFRELTRMRLDRLLQSHWIPALAGDVVHGRQALAVIDTQIKFEGQYPAVAIDLNASFESRVAISEDQMLRVLAEMQANRIMEADELRRRAAIDAVSMDVPSPALGNGSASNGHS